MKKIVYNLTKKEAFLFTADSVENALDQWMDADYALRGLANEAHEIVVKNWRGRVRLGYQLYKIALFGPDPCGYVESIAPTNVWRIASRLWSVDMDAREILIEYAESDKTKYTLVQNVACVLRTFFLVEEYGFGGKLTSGSLAIVDRAVAASKSQDDNQKMRLNHRQRRKK